MIRWIDTIYDLIRRKLRFNDGWPENRWTIDEHRLQMRKILNEKQWLNWEKKQ